MTCDIEAIYSYNCLTLNVSTPRRLIENISVVILVWWEGRCPTSAFCVVYRSLGCLLMRSLLAMTNANGLPEWKPMRCSSLVHCTPGHSWKRLDIFKSAISKSPGFSLKKGDGCLATYAAKNAVLPMLH